MLQLHFSRNDFHPIALKMHWLMVVKIIFLLTRHGLDGNSLEQGEEGAISSICHPSLFPENLGSGHPLVLGGSHPFVILDSTLLPSYHSFGSLAPPSLSNASGSHPRAKSPI